MIFVLAAYCEALDAAHRDEWTTRKFARTLGSETPLEKVQYEATRLEGGMKIEAKNLGFTYPNSTEPVLRNINLTIEAGETLAIVGFNGGG